MEQWPVLRFFNFEHLPSEMQGISKPFHDLAHAIVAQEDRHEHIGEIYRSLEKLLEAKDCAVRGFLKIK